MIETQICAYPQFPVMHLSSSIELLGFFVKFSDARQFVDPLWSTIQMDPARRIAFFLLPKYQDGYYNSTWCSGKLRYCSFSYSFNSLNSFDGSRLFCEKWSQVVKIVALKSVTESFHAHWDIEWYRSFGYKHGTNNAALVLFLVKWSNESDPLVKWVTHDTIAGSFTSAKYLTMERCSLSVAKCRY